jgi:TnpA family transposase
MMSLFGFRFAPRIRDLADKRLYVPGKDQRFPALAGLIGGTINSRLIAAQWQEVLRLAASIRQGTVTASLILRKLGSYPVRIAWLLHCAKSGASNGPSLPLNGCKVPICAAGFRSV